MLHRLARWDPRSALSQTWLTPRTLRAPTTAGWNAAHHRSSGREAGPVRSAYRRRTVWVARPTTRPTELLDRKPSDRSDRAAAGEGPGGISRVSEGSVEESAMVADCRSARPLATPRGSHTRYPRVRSCCEAESTAVVSGGQRSSVVVSGRQCSSVDHTQTRPLIRAGAQRALRAPLRSSTRAISRTSRSRETSGTGNTPNSTGRPWSVTRPPPRGPRPG